MNQSNQIFTEPLGCLDVLRKSFLIMKNNALKLTCLALLFCVPMLIIVCALMKIYFVDFSTGTFHNANPLMWLSLLFLISFGLLYVSALMIAIKNCLQNIPINIGDILRQAFARMLPVVVTCFLLYILFCLLGGLMAVIMVVPITLITSPILAYQVIIVFIMLACLYFFIRFCFFLPPILWEGRFFGLSDSWRLTKNNFWWLVGLGILISIIMFIVSIALMLLGMLIGSLDQGTSLHNMIIMNILLAPINIIIYMFSFTVYTVTYFNLHARNEAADRPRAVCEDVV